MLYLLRGTGRGNEFGPSSEGCFRDEARKALAFIAMPVALTGRPIGGLTLGEEGPDGGAADKWTVDGLSRD